MQQQGVLLSIASKNNSEDVQSAFRENPHMILKESDFSAIYADWNPKPVNIGKIAEELNLGLDSFVFVDDNEADPAAGSDSRGFPDRPYDAAGGDGRSL